MQSADETRVVWMVADRNHVDREILCPEDDLGPGNGELAEATVAEAAADNDPLGLSQTLDLRKRRGDVGEFLSEILDRAVHDRGGFCIVSDRYRVQYLLADGIGRFLAERVLAGLAQGLPPFFEDIPEGTLAGAISNESFRPSVRY